ncbi:nucleotide exchange factor GrpE [Buchnera aphidicola]|uniref:nucleotide exchange factor GrpE n=1 Tax=Buchnera aphidicola TaxID=9 RepID=UPI00254348A7|nr:nucleotide exchange factor GrpE [Buchnera aphidicola]WII23810.1 nucleotide exchange factor GrpE [Buchnera aphidicola (Sipha maydis)]
MNKKKEKIKTQINNNSKTKENIIKNKKEKKKKKYTPEKIFKIKKKIDQIKKKIQECPLRLLANIENLKKNTQENYRLITQNKKKKFIKKITLISNNLKNIINDLKSKKYENIPEFQGIILIQQSLKKILKNQNLKKY